MVNSVNKVKLVLNYQKSTKNKHVYGSKEDGAPIESVYISKTVFSGKEPKTLTIFLESADENN